MIQAILRVISAILTFGMMLYGSVLGINFNDTIGNYKDNVEKVAYENDFDTALPQTEIYSIVQNFYNAPLPEGKTEKKVAVIGFDGCRADILSLMGSEDTSAIKTLKNQGGNLVLSYCGGVNYPAFNTQATSTAPGWCSMVTGEWADVHGVTDNSIPMKLTKHTLFTSLIEEGKADATAFYVSWGGHFSSDDSTYSTELAYIQQNNLNATFLKANDDAGTVSNTLADINRTDCSDFIFCIIEANDHVGHDTGFCPANPDQAVIFAEAEGEALQMIHAIENRATYNTEDWLILITADHGGYNTGHGFVTMMERYTFIASNKPIIATEK